jgi:cyclic pyranopterin monophosphate synthase
MNDVNKFSHLDENGKATMVDVSHKKDQLRIAKARGKIILSPSTMALVRENKIKKGDVLTVAKIAGIQAAKKTFELIPLCHSLTLANVEINSELVEDGVDVNSEVTCVGPTGVEMEALTAVSVALLTIYDMCKAVDKSMVIGDITLVEKIKQDIV